jgi:hypothetical protein
LVLKQTLIIHWGYSFALKSVHSLMEKPTKPVKSPSSRGRKKNAKNDYSALTPEEAIPRLAKSGELAEAGQNAIKASFHKGLPVTVLEGEHIVRLHPDGTKTVLKKLGTHTRTGDSANNPH